MATSGISEIDIELPGHPDGSSAGRGYSIDFEKLGGNNMVIMGNTGAPIVTSKEELLQVIPRRGPIHRPCAKCQKSPEKGKTFMECAQCKQSHYCGRECQKAHWKEHKPLCLQRKAQQEGWARAEEAALKAGKIFYSPKTSQAWYRKNTDIVSHATFHVLELYKGPSASLHRTHIAWFELSFDKDKPKDVDAISLHDVKAAPLDIIGERILGAATVAHIKHGIELGMMPCIMTNKELNAMTMEMHQAPEWRLYTSGLKKPDENWKIHCILMAGGALDKVV